MKTVLFKSALVAGGLALSSATGWAQDVNWVYANGYAKDHVQVGLLADEFIDRIQKATGGRLKIRHVSGGTLLKPENMVEGIRGRVANMGSTVVSFFPGQLPISATLAGLVDLKYGNKMSFAGTMEVTTQLLNEVPEFSAEYEKLGLKVIWFVPSPAYAVISKAPIAKVADFEGKKIRTFGNILPNLFKAAGSVPVSVAFGEIYTSIQTGVIDGALTDPPAMLTAKLQEVGKNVVTLGPGLGAMTAITPVAYFVNLQDWNALPQDMKDSILKSAKEMTPIGAKKMEEAAKGALSQLEAQGVKVHHLTQAETDAWAAKAPDFMALAAGVLKEKGLPGDQILERYRKLADAQIAKQ